MKYLQWIIKYRGKKKRNFWRTRVSSFLWFERCKVRSRARISFPARIYRAPFWWPRSEALPDLPRVNDGRWELDSRRSPANSVDGKAPRSEVSSPMHLADAAPRSPFPVSLPPRSPLLLEAATFVVSFLLRLSGFLPDCTAVRNDK